MEGRERSRLASPPPTCRARCGLCDAIDNTSTQVHSSPRTSFYLEARGALNFSSLLANETRPPDLAFPVSWGQYLIESPLLRALASHPRRTHLPSLASIHVLAVTPWASMIEAERRGKGWEHSERMERAAEELARHDRFQASRGSGTLFVQLLGGEALHTMGDAYQRQLVKGNVLLGCKPSSLLASPPHANLIA